MAGEPGKAGGELVPVTDGVPAASGGLVRSPLLDMSVPVDPYGARVVTSREPSALILLLLRRKWLILSVFTAACLATIPLIWLLIKPTYVATATVRISPVLDRMVFQSEKTNVIPFYDAYVNTQVAIIRSPALLERVLDRQEVRETQWYRENPSARLEALQGILEVAARRGTELLDVSVKGLSSRETTEIVNVIVGEYKKLNDETSKASDTTLFETLTRERDQLQMGINGMIETKFNIASQLGTTAPEELRSQLSVQLSNLESTWNQSTREMKMLQWQLSRMPAASSRPSTQEGGGSIYAVDPEWRNLDQKLQEARSSLELAKQRKFGESHPVRQELANSIKLYEDLLKRREGQLDQMWGNSIGQATTMPEGPASWAVVQHLAEKKKREVELLIEEIERQRAKVTRTGEIAQEIARYEDEIAQKRELKEAIRKRLEVLEMEGKAPARVRVAAYAVEQSKPDRDRRRLLTILAVAGSLVLAVGTGHLRSSLDRRVYEIGEVQGLYQVPHLGMLPYVRRANLPRELGGASQTGGDSWAKASKQYAYASQHRLMEHVRMIRTKLLERVGHGKERIVLVTSAMASTGKTSVALLLARSLAVVGHRVLLVEGDVRRPALAVRLGLTTQDGLYSLLTKSIDEHQAILASGVVNLDLVLAGEVPESFDPELLAVGVFTECLRRWRERYDFVLLDSPPVLAVADAQILAGLADGVIMVLRASHDRRVEAAEAYGQLVAVGARVLGTVLIGGGEGDGYPYGYYYNSYGYRPKTEPQGSSRISS